VQGQVVRLVADVRVEEVLRGLTVGSGIEPADVKEEEVKGRGSQRGRHGRSRARPPGPKFLRVPCEAIETIILELGRAGLMMD
jgi:hypothetical protein